MAYTDLFNETIDDIVTSLSTITGLRVVTNPNNINPPCVFVDAPSFEAYNANIADMTFPIRVISLGPAGLDALRNTLSICAQLLTKNVAITSGRPISISIGGQELAAYDLTLRVKAQQS